MSHTSESRLDSPRLSAGVHRFPQAGTALREQPDEGALRRDREAAAGRLRRESWSSRLATRSAWTSDAPGRAVRRRARRSLQRSWPIQRKWRSRRACRSREPAACRASSGGPRKYTSKPSAASSHARARDRRCAWIGEHWSRNTATCRPAGYDGGDRWRHVDAASRVVRQARQGTIPPVPARPWH